MRLPHAGAVNWKICGICPRCLSLRRCVSTQRRELETIARRRSGVSRGENLAPQSLIRPARSGALCETQEKKELLLNVLAPDVRFISSTPERGIISGYLITRAGLVRAMRPVKSGPFSRRAR